MTQVRIKLYDSTSTESQYLKCKETGSPVFDVPSHWGPMVDFLVDMRREPLVEGTFKELDAILNRFTDWDRTPPTLNEDDGEWTTSHVQGDRYYCVIVQKYTSQQGHFSVFLITSGDIL